MEINLLPMRNKTVYTKKRNKTCDKNNKQRKAIFEKEKTHLECQQNKDLEFERLSTLTFCIMTLAKESLFLILYFLIQKQIVIFQMQIKHFAIHFEDKIYKREDKTQVKKQHYTANEKLLLQGPKKKLMLCKKIVDERKRLINHFK